MRKLLKLLPTLLVAVLLLPTWVGSQVSGPAINVITDANCDIKTCTASQEGYVCVTGGTFYACNTGGGTFDVITGTSSTIPGGADTQCQFNNAGAFGGDAGCTYDPVGDDLTIVGDVAAATFNSIDPATWVVGPASATDNSIARFNLVTGKLIQDTTTVATLSDTGTMILNGGAAAYYKVDQSAADNNGLWLETSAAGPTPYISFRTSTAAAKTFIRGNSSGDFEVMDGTTPFDIALRVASASGAAAGSDMDVSVLNGALIVTQAGLTVQSDGVINHGAGVDDDVCDTAGEWWWDPTDAEFEFCKVGSGTPDTWGSGVGGSPLTTKGDLFVFSTTDDRLPATGGDLQLLMTRTGDATGLDWMYINNALITADATPDGAADYVLTWDNDAATHKKVLLDNLPGGGGSNWVDEGTILRPGDAADDWLRVSGATNAPGIGTTDNASICFDPNGGASLTCDWSMNSTGDLSVNTVTTTPSDTAQMLLETLTSSAQVSIGITENATGPDAIMDLSADIGGTQAVFMNLDGVDETLEMLKAIDVGTAGTFGSGDTTPSVMDTISGSSGSYFFTHTVTVTISDFDNGTGPALSSGHVLWVQSAGATTYDCTTSGLDCGTTDIVTASGDVTEWVYTGTNWQLIAYKDQSTDMGTDDTGSGSLGSDLDSTTNDITTGEAGDLLRLAGAGESFDLDFTTGTANEVGVSSATGVLQFDFGAIDLEFGGFVSTDESFVDELGLEFEEGTGLTDCSTFATTGGGIFYSDTDNEFKKCENNSLSALDTTGAGGLTDVRIPIINQWTIGDSGDVFFQPYSVQATTGVWEHIAVVFNDSGNRDCLHGRTHVPNDFTDEGDIVLVWTSPTATSGDVEWDFDYRVVGGNDTESLDQSGQSEANTGNNDTAPSAINERMEYLIDIDSGNTIITAGDTMQFKLCRSSDDVGDTLTDEVILMEAFFEYDQ